MQMSVIVKTRCFYDLPLIHNQNSQNSVYYSWHIYQEKLATKFNNVSWWVFWIGNLTRAFSLKTIIWTWIFFKHCRVLSLKRNKKSSQKRCKSHKNCLTVDIARGRSKTLKKDKKNEKWEKVKQQLFSFTFLYRKIYILLESVFGKT